jgi:hypothetical protein
MTVLTMIPGELLGAAAHSLPEARDCGEQTQSVVLRLPDGQRAEVSFVKLRSKKGKTTRWFWTPDSAQILDA